MSHRKSQRKLFLLLFIPLWVLLTAFGALWLAWDLREQRAGLEQAVARQTREITRFAELEIKNLVSDATLLAVHPDRSRLEQPLDLLGRAYLAFCRSKSGITRIQLLDGRGRRLLLVDPRREAVLPGHQAGPAGRRSLALARETAELAPNELVLGDRRPTDSEPEWGIELGLPVFDQKGRRWAVMLVEFSGPEFAQSLVRGLAGPARLWILDRRGKPLYCDLLPGGRPGPPPPVGAGEMDCGPGAEPHGPGPAAPRREASHLRVFFPMREALGFSTGGGEAALTSAAATRLAREQRWTFLVQHPLPTVTQAMAASLHWLLPSYLAAALALAMISWFTSSVLRRRMAAQADRRLAEERFRIRTAFDHSAIGVAVVSLEGRFLEANRYLCRLLGAEHSGLIGHGFAPYVHPQDHRRLVSRFNRMMERSLPSVWMEARLVTSGGQTCWAMLSVSLAGGGEGRPRHCVVHVQDITERKRLAAEKQAMEAELRRALKLEAIGTLASGIAHDFNNILGIVLTNTELCLKGGHEETDLKRRLTRVLRASQRGRDLVRQIMDFYSPQEPEREPLNLAGAVEEILHLLGASFPKSIRLEPRLDQPGPVVLASVSEIQQVVTNLCVNAVQAMGEAGGTLSVRVDMAGEALRGGTPAWARVQIEDTGCGMDQATAEKAFDLFFTTKGEGQGTGLGLSTVQRVVNSLGGKVSILSQPGQGTVVSVFLPVSAMAPRQGRLALVPRTSGGHLLLVDDEESYVAALAEALEGFGFQVTALADPERAWSLFQEHPERFLALVTDHHMPGLSGAELAQRAMGLRPGLPVVLCTGSPQVAPPQAPGDWENWRVLRKPFSIVELLEQIEALVHPGGRPSDDHPAAEDPGRGEPDANLGA